MPEARAGGGLEFVNQAVRKGLIQVSSIVVGLIAVAASSAFSILYPVRPLLVVVESLAFSCGTTPRGGYQRHSWTMKNGGSVSLNLRTRFTSGRCGFSLWQGQDHEIPPGESITVSLTCPTPHHPGSPYSGHAEVSTNDSESPRVRFRIFGISGTD